MKGRIPTETEGAPSSHVIVEAAGRLTEEEQEILIEILSRRLADHRRVELVKDVEDAQREFERGALRSTTGDEIMKEVLS